MGEPSSKVPLGHDISVLILAIITPLEAKKEKKVLHGKFTIMSSSTLNGIFHENYLTIFHFSSSRPTTAAKTLAIIVGLFILCWLPFFTLYLIRPFCNDCINDVLFSAVFWIGYCNSAINPMIYALFSKDFRFAFKRIICKCFCSGPGLPKPSSRRGSDMSAFRHHGGQRTPSISPSQLAQSIGDDSDPISDDLHR
jgi:7 transmembrane receptor (rhodopsin family)